MKALAGVALGAAVGWLALHQLVEGPSEARGEPGIEVLCEDGNPAKRLPDCPRGTIDPGVCISYGGLPGRYGYQRDHWISLGIGGSDTAENVHYKRCDRFGQFGKCEAGPASPGFHLERFIQSSCQAEFIPRTKDRVAGFLGDVVCSMSYGHAGFTGFGRQIPRPRVGNP